MKENNMPEELKQLLSDRGVEYRYNEHSSNDRVFGDVVIHDDKFDAKVSVVHLPKGDWDFIHIEYKNCIYQDEPKQVMLKGLASILEGKVKLERTLFRKKEKWQVLDSDGGVILSPYDVF